MGAVVPPVPKKKGLPGWLKKVLNVLLLVLQKGKDDGYFNKR